MIILFELLVKLVTLPGPLEIELFRGAARGSGTPKRTPPVACLDESPTQLIGAASGSQSGCAWAASAPRP